MPAQSQPQQAFKLLSGFARRDPELYVLAGAVVLTVAGMGYWFGRSAGTAEKYGESRGNVGLPWSKQKRPDASETAATTTESKK
ncbi:hypothetical protein POJ06DRAFT_106574 [Lipomyces tetrasporus]|uniref:Uncharacterized protein n=1 Tax=Lipomyces tetrasporus TaxID=54092 RepID=A0AAD7VT16_9ASCO|nr:uncharacterized protein POJ06DRAFT_106574 [Lipomyces tetrasporus]KAJ8100541.1 hypothetical protein POJ06DRAFT_106574 [Lipomyces tetrasporus]